MTKVLFTIGYEGRTPEELVTVLVQAGVRCVIDVRARASSRRPGFAKTKLARKLESVGIAYVHYREAGNPHRHAPHPKRLERFAKELAPQVVERVAKFASLRRCALLCAEADAHTCHRCVLSERVVALRPWTFVRHL